MPQVIGITALNRYVKSVLEGDAVLADLALRGEIANFVRHAKSGHCYFSLRDAQSSVKAVMFSRDAARLAFRPQDGMQVVVRCRVSLYERDGAFQVYVRDLMPDGIGAAQMAFEELKARLAAEGLFRPEAKQPLPPMPSCVGVVTSGTGAALRVMRPPRTPVRAAVTSRAGKPRPVAPPNLAPGPCGPGPGHHCGPGRRFPGGPVGVQRRGDCPRRFCLPHAVDFGGRA